MPRLRIFEIILHPFHKKRMPYDLIEDNQLIIVSVKLNHISVIYWVLISIIVNQSSIFGHISAKFAQNWTILNLKNLANCLAKWQSSIWLNLAKFRPSFGYFENFDLATLSRSDITQRPAAMTFSNFLEYKYMYVYSNAACETHGSGAADEKV